MILIINYINYSKVINMKIKDFIGSTVIDKNANDVGKVDNIEFDVESGQITTITLSLQKNLFTRDELEISYDDIQTIFHNLS